MRHSQLRKQLAPLIGRNIGKLRYQRGLTQEAIAELAEINTRHYQKIEAGEVCPSFPLLVKLRRAVDAEWSELLRGID